MNCMVPHNIPLVQINWRGEIINVVSENPENTISDRVIMQQKTKIKDGGLKFAINLVREKITNSIGTLRLIFPGSLIAGAAIKKLENEIALLRRAPPASVSQLMGTEGRVGYAYFDAWRTMKITWKSTDRHPIPEDWCRIDRRSSKLGNRFHPNRNATHPVNAMLNYAYGVLESKIRMQVVASGLDPTIGILHGNARGQHGLVYDLMEPSRPLVDRKVLEFVRVHKFHPADFTIRSDGVCRLNPEMARNIVQCVVFPASNSNPSFQRSSRDIAP
jgi:CRISP-associated protein Cas1